MSEIKNNDIEKNSKRTNFAYRFVLIILATILCVVSLIAVTFGWFSDREEEFIHVTSGDVKIDVFQADDSGDYLSIKNGKGDIFGFDVWEPNQTRIVFFKVKSESNIRIKYTMQFYAIDEGLLGAFEYITYEGKYFDPTGMSYADLLKDHKSVKVSNGANLLSEDGFVYLEPGEEHYYVLALHMNADATNEFQGESFLLNLDVMAVQGNYYAETTESESEDATENEESSENNEFSETEAVTETE